MASNLYNALKAPKRRRLGTGGTSAPAAAAGPAIGSAQPTFGPQLAARVNSGAITQEQAQRTMAQRQTFRNAYGQDWRKKVFGGTNLTNLRTSIAGGSATPQQGDLYKTLMANRKRLLARAQRKLSGAVSSNTGV
jgi:hypothetical protein